MTSEGFGGVKLSNDLSDKDKTIYTIMSMPKDKYDDWFNSLSEDAQISVGKLLIPRMSRYVPKFLETDDGRKAFQLSPKQTLYCLLDNKLVLAGGSGGGGKVSPCLWQGYNTQIIQNTMQRSS